ncbi:MAG: hypothetical protein IKR33_04630 [Bacteroidales bacterium]|nr:hypothetical protein [Bacteroidales bacterium]
MAYTQYPRRTNTYRHRRNAGEGTARVGRWSCVSVFYGGKMAVVLRLSVVYG